MSTLEIKEKVIENLELVQDEKLLEEILWLLGNSVSSDNEVEIPESHKRGITEGLKDIEAGRLISQKELDVKIKKWL